MAQPQPSLLSELVHVSDALDRIISDLQLGRPLSREPHLVSDEIRDRVEQLAARARAAVRGSTRPTAAPIWANGAGKAAW